MKSMPNIVLFRQDLRLKDNPALWHACQEDAPLILLYVYDDETPGVWNIGGAQKWWLHESLKELGTRLSKYKSQLVLRKGPTEKVLLELKEQYGAAKLFFNRCYEPYWLEFEQLIQKKMETRVCQASLFLEPNELLNRQGTPFKVFTPFWNTARKDLRIPDGFPEPSIKPFKTIHSDNLEEWGLLPSHPNWAKEFSTVWQPGEAGAAKKLNEFADRVDSYKERRDYPAEIATSLLSPHLHFGEISLGTIYNALCKYAGFEEYLRELGWREFAHYMLYHFPDLPTRSFQDRFNRFPWSFDKAALECWQKGKTGVPIVDAGMRQLWRIGWMHNRVRMIVGSFLTKNLLIPWQEGEKWFWDTLVDADLANNAFGWQWIAGCGADAAPFFRIFNPILQGEKFDPEGSYVKKWVPELQDLPAEYVHEPWNAPPMILRAAGVEIGRTYPKPIVDLQETREKALAYFSEINK